MSARAYFLGSNVQVINCNFLNWRNDNQMQTLGLYIKAIECEFIASSVVLVHRSIDTDIVRWDKPALLLHAILRSYTCMR